MSTKKDELILTAEKLFYQAGFHSIGLKRIVNESKVAMMTMYNHFTSKDELVLEVLRRRESRYMDRLYYHIQDERQKDKPVLIRIAEAHADWIMEAGSNGCLFLRAKEEYGELADHPVVQLVNSHKQRLKHLILESDPDHNEVNSLQLTLLMEGATSLAETESRQKVTEQFLNITQRLFL